MNAHCERFNRTVQEEFFDVPEKLLFYELPQFNLHLLELARLVQHRATPPRAAAQNPS
jgi:hypothetical protein